MRRRAFALAVVILLGAVVVIMSGVMIQRHGASRLNVDQELAAYQAHHAGRGLTEATWAWVQTIPSDGVRKMISAEGHAFDLILDDATVIRVTLEDAQGSILVNPDELSSRDRDQMAGVLLELQQAGNIPDSYLRQVGPVKISAMTAPPELLRALASHVTEGDGDVDEFVDIVLEARLEDGFKDLDVTQAMSKADFSTSANSRLRRLLTAEPTLWKVRAEITPRGARRPTDAYEGIAQIETRGGRRGSSSFSPWGPFLSWERVDPVALGAGGTP